jgi:hypothetical protein
VSSKLTVICMVKLLCLLAFINMDPDTTWDALTAIGFISSNRHWYQCVAGAEGAVLRHTIVVEPLKFTSNQLAIPWRIDVLLILKEKGMLIVCISSNDTV